MIRFADLQAKYPGLEKTEILQLWNMLMTRNWLTIDHIRYTLAQRRKYPHLAWRNLTIICNVVFVKVADPQNYPADAILFAAQYETLSSQNNFIASVT